MVRTWTRSCVTLATIDPQSRERTDDQFEALVSDALAVHRTLRHEGASADWQKENGVWSVSHRPTGMRIAGFDSLFLALDFAERALALCAPWHSGAIGEPARELLPWGEALAEIYREVTG